MNSNNPHKKLEVDGRVPPQAIEVEEAVLGAMLTEAGAAEIVLGRLRKEDFYKPANQHIFETIWSLYEDSKPIDLLSLENELKDKNLLDTCGGLSYLVDLTRSVSSAANIEYHSQIILEKSLMRKLILSSTETLKEAYDTTNDPYDVIEGAEKRIYGLVGASIQSETVHAEDLIHKNLEYFGEIRKHPDMLTGVPTGLDIDKLTGGWQKGDLIIIAARPSMGKTAFLLTVARNAALHNDPNKRTGVVVFSLEMSKDSLIQRLITMEARVDSQRARTGKSSDEEYRKMIDASARLYEAELYIDDTPALNIIELRSKCRQLKRKDNIGLICVDYLQLMSGASNDKAGNREQEIAYISRSLKALAKEMDVPVIALSQLSRDVVKRGGDKRPVLSDLRESGQIEQDADVVIFLHRPEYYGIKTDEEGRSTAGLAEIILAKQRNGPTGTRPAAFIEEYARFEPLARERIPEPVPEGTRNYVDTDLDDDLPF